MEANYGTQSLLIGRDKGIMVITSKLSDIDSPLMQISSAVDDRLSWFHRQILSTATANQTTPTTCTQ